MRGYLGGKSVTLDQSAVLGKGGFGTVFAWKDKAVKLLLNPTSQDAAKITAMVAKPPDFPNGRGTLPLELFTDAKGGFLGYSMPKIEAGYENIDKLSNKQHRKQHGDINARSVVKIFKDGLGTMYRFHASGYVGGDVSVTNEKYQGFMMLYLDIDAFQVGKYACPSGSEQTLTPRLYGVDLKLAPVFKPEDDRYSLAVLLHKSLLLAHPYGGSHKTINNLLERARQRIPITSPDVTYPTIALPYDIISDDLAQTFWKIFKQGEYGALDMRDLDTYENTLVDCPNCGTAYPSERKHCPMCSTKTIMIPRIAAPLGMGISVQKLFDVEYPIIFSRLIGDMLYYVEAAPGSTLVVFHKVHLPTMAHNRIPVQHYEPGMRFDIVKSELVTNRPNHSVIQQGGQVLTTMMFAGTNKAMFRSNGRYLFRLAAGALMYGEWQGKDYVERTLRSASQDQTWFTVRQDNKDRPTACGFFQVERYEHWWLVFEGRLYDDLRLMPLDANEVQTSVLVRMDARGALIKRVTDKGGVEYLHTSYISEDGLVTNQAPVKLTQPLPHGALFAHSALLFGGDDGLTQERNGVLKTFSTTKGVVEEGDTLYEFGKDLIVVKENAVLQIKLG